MNIFMREIKANRKSLIIWCIGVIFMVISSMGKYAGMSSSGQSMNELMASMPKSLQVIMGTGAFDLSKASGYYGTIFLYLLLMATIHAVMIGANIVSKEERDHTAEFLFVKPISRKNIITFKLAAALLQIIVFNVITLISSILAVAKYSSGEKVTDDITLLMLAMFILQLLFMVIGSAMAAVMKNPKSSTAHSTGLLLITFILSITIDLNRNLASLNYFTPFKYFEAKNIMYGGGFDIPFVILSLVLIATLSTITYVFFQKRDLYV